MLLIASIFGLDCAGYPTRPPSGGFWDPETKGHARGSEVAQGHQARRGCLQIRMARWQALYHPFDRRHVDAHPDWPKVQEPHGTRDHTIIDFLLMVTGSSTQASTQVSEEGTSPRIPCSFGCAWLGLRQRGAGSRESGAFLLGRAARKFPSSNIHWLRRSDPKGAHTGIVSSEVKFQSFGRKWQAAGAPVLADVHTHGMTTQCKASPIAQTR